MVCDICNSLGMGTIISTNQMREAVFSRGFNPFKMGLVGNPAPNIVGTVILYLHWKYMIVAKSTSDWNICAKCIAQLKPHLSGQHEM
jgi:hypothetical protein